MATKHEIFTREDKPWVRVVWHERGSDREGVGSLVLQVRKSWVDAGTVDEMEKHRQVLRDNDIDDVFLASSLDGDDEWLDVVLTWETNVEYGFDLMSRVAGLLYKDEVIQQDKVRADEGTRCT